MWFIKMKEFFVHPYLYFRYIDRSRRRLAGLWGQAIMMPRVYIENYTYKQLMGSFC